MVKIVVLIGFAIPGIIAAIFAAALLLQPDVPSSAATERDRISVEYAKHQLTASPTGVAAGFGVQKTEILEISNDGSLRYHLVENGVSSPSISWDLDESELQRLKALIKETGFVALPEETFPVMDGVDSYQKSSVRVTLNDVVTEVRWPDQNATEAFIPPIITMIESELDGIIDSIR